MQVSDRYEMETTVTEKLLAKNVGSGDVSVFATPMMIALMENTASKCAAQTLDEGMTTVGTSICVSHSAATPAGMKVRCEAIITEVDGRKITFHVAAFDEAGLIGEGTHTRVVVSRERFDQKAAAKLR
ncbi:thioesterase family protein [Candidatus Soleaferrea massiliensis]|uniref:thioesterase family protein n=1 Tax=Candidatus Soleaferrea massiliensis TaxID=1470354 RepID=UPI00058C029B|nr:thioesterase family protein [Candidatus Soleaferrea massiliensis]